MDYSKPVTQSITVWAGTITLLSGTIVLIAKAFGVDLLQDEIEQILYATITAVLGIVAIYGRIRAKTKIK